MRAIDSDTASKNERVNAISKRWFESKIISVIQKRDKLYSI